MTGFLMNTTPLWVDTAPVNRFPALQDEVRVDVAIIGGGITGITAASMLKRSGKTVAVIELHRVGQGETGHTTAHLTEVLDLDYQDLISKFGIEYATLASQSCRTAIRRIERNIKELNISCGFTEVSGYKYTEHAADIEYLEREADAALQVSVPNTLTEDVPLPFATAMGLRFDHQAQFHPLEYLVPLAMTIPGKGSHIFENTHVLDVDDGSPCRVYSDYGTIVAEDVIVAANVPILNRIFLHSKLASYRTYAIAVRAKSIPEPFGLFWDTASPYHYIRSHFIDGKQYLIVGGEDHKTGHLQRTADAFSRLESFTNERFDVESVDYQWSGQIIQSVDGLPLIGRNSFSDHIYVATGYSGTGMTFGTVAGHLLSDLILGIENPWAELYSATRIKPMAGARDFLLENADYPAHLLRDRLSPFDVRDINSITEHSGGIIRVGAKKVAAYRDPEGMIHLRSPVCPHLGCYVNWNDAEKSWDCPCHGSRFSPLGEVFNGPARTDLATETYDENFLFLTERYETETESPPPLSPLFFSLIRRRSQLS